jgi:hypothetical protein
MKNEALSELDGLVAIVTGDRIDGRWEASDDSGTTWRKEFDLVFERRT